MIVILKLHYLVVNEELTPAGYHLHCKFFCSYIFALYFSILLPRQPFIQLIPFRPFLKFILSMSVFLFILLPFFLFHLIFILFFLFPNVPYLRGLHFFTPIFFGEGNLY
jgi:hypothetical protein